MDLFKFGSVMGCMPDISKVWLPEFEKVFAKYDISTKMQQAAFLAQVGHETAGLSHFTENLRYRPETLMRMWPKRFPDMKTANYYGFDEERTANQAYGSRFGNGGYNSGDGYKYRGRGPFQITFADNYRTCGKALNLPLIENPDLLLKPEHGAMSAGWYWTWKGCNSVALLNDCDAVSDLINLGKQTPVKGDSNGYADRKSRYENAMRVLA